MRIVGLTGSIGSGKSTAAKYFEQLGAIIVSADQLARKTVETGQPAYQELVEIFGTEILQADHTIDRKKLASIVFKDKEALKHLNQITHREIKRLRKKRILEILHHSPDAIVICEIPLLFECRMQSDYQTTVLITIDEAVRQHRLQQNRGLSNSEIEARLKHQMPQADKIKLADIIIHNDGSTKELQSDLNAAFDEILKLENLPAETIKNKWIH